MGLQIKSKYHAKRVTLPNGMVFASKHEYERWQVLKSLEDNGIIRDLKCQVPFELIPAQEVPHPFLKKGKSGKSRMVNKLPACKYYADFTYKNFEGEMIVEDAKGFETPEYKIKKKLMLEKYHIQIVEV